MIRPFPLIIPPAGVEYDPRMGVRHVIGGVESDGHPGEPCLVIHPLGDADAPSAADRIHKLRTTIDRVIDGLNAAWAETGDALWPLEACITDLQKARTDDDIAQGRDWPPVVLRGDADAPVWRVHNHGPHEGRGTACREYHLNGRLVGACKIAAATSSADAGAGGLTTHDPVPHFVGEFSDEPRSRSCRLCAARLQAADEGGGE